MSRDGILYIADPGSIHDRKWISPFAQSHRVFLLSRICHADAAKSLDSNVTYLGALDDFSLRHPLISLVSLCRLLRCIREHRISLIHIMYADPNALWALFRRWLRVPVVLTTRGTDALRALPSMLARTGWRHAHVRIAYRLALSRLDAVTCTSKGQIESMRALGLPAARLHLVRTGIDIEATQAAVGKQPVGIPPDCRYVLFPRLMRPIYQHEYALAEIARLDDDLRRDLVFVFIGANDGPTDYRQAIAEQMSITPARIIWLDAQPQEALWSLILAAELVVMTPASDGSPVTAMEAFLLSRPVILPPLPYDDDLFGEAALFFQNWSPGALSTLMGAVLRGERLAPLALAKERALAGFDRRLEMGKVAAIYAGLVTGNANG